LSTQLLKEFWATSYCCPNFKLSFGQVKLGLLGQSSHGFIIWGTGCFAWKIWSFREVSERKGHLNDGKMPPKLDSLSKGVSLYSPFFFPNFPIPLIFSTGSPWHELGSLYWGQHTYGRGFGISLRLGWVIGVGHPETREIFPLVLNLPIFSKCFPRKVN